MNYLILLNSHHLKRKELSLFFASTEGFSKLRYAIWLTAVKDLEKVENRLLRLNLEESFIVAKRSAS